MVKIPKISTWILARRENLLHLDFLYECYDFLYPMSQQNFFFHRSCNENETINYDTSSTVNGIQIRYSLVSTIIY